MSALQPQETDAHLDGLRILAQLVAGAWRAGGLPPQPDTPPYNRRKPVEVVLVPYDGAS